jgi:hypothetical protein
VAALGKWPAGEWARMGNGEGSARGGGEQLEIERGFLSL